MSNFHAAIMQFVVVIVLIISLVFLSTRQSIPTETLHQLYTWIGIAIATLFVSGAATLKNNKPKE